MEEHGGDEYRPDFNLAHNPYWPITASTPVLSHRKRIDCLVKILAGREELQIGEFLPTQATAKMAKIPNHSKDFETLEKMEWAFSKGDIPYFKSVLDSRPSIVLRIHAVCMLADMKNEAAIPLLAEALRTDSSPLVRHEAAFAMGQLEFKSAVPSLVEAMENDSSVLVRHESAVALGSIGDERARTGLIARLEDSDEDVRLSAECALADLDFLKRLRSRTETIPVESG